MAQTPDWLRLQRKIFSRWVNQKLCLHGLHCEDVVKEVGDGILIIRLLEVLSEKKFTGKLNKMTKMKPQKIDNCNMALGFVFKDCAVEMNRKPSAEDLVDGDERNILSLTWAIMLKYMKFGDEDDVAQLNAKDALLMWVKNKTKEYRDVNVADFKQKSWLDGMALCAIIHKHRPRLIDYDRLNKAQKKENVALAMEAANRYFDLEKYLSVEDFWKLDDNSMVVYVSEYYYGIAEQRKLDLAAKRIAKVVKLTKENDAMRAAYAESARKFLETLQRWEKVLEDRTIDNTMAGAQRRLAQFYEYKTKDKNTILGAQLDMEALYNNLAMVLAHHKRPEFIPPKGCSLKEVDVAVKHLEACEQERKVALHAELNRQLRLLDLDGQHKGIDGKLRGWIAEKEQYLRTREEIHSVSAAQLNLRLLDAYDKEALAVKQGTIVEFSKIGAELIQEKYERSQEVKGREDKITVSMKTLDALSTEKRPILDDHLAREMFAVKVRLMAKEHANQYEELALWINEKENYLQTREDVTSVAEARTQLSILDSYNKDNAEMVTTNVKELKQFGAEILAQKYETKYSRYVYEKPDEINGMHKNVDDKWKVLASLAEEKKRVLDDHLARNHIDKHDKLLSTWVDTQKKYLLRKEVIDSVSEAKEQLTLLESFEKAKERTVATRVATIKDLGKQILAKKYQSTYSSYSLETPEEIHTRERGVDAAFDELNKLAAEKKRVLQADLERELEKERLRLEFAHSTSDFLRWKKEMSEQANVSHFGFTLEEVEAYQQTLNASNSSITSEADGRQANCKDIFNQMTQLGVKENMYTTNTLDTLQNARQELEASLAARNEKYQAELARQRYNDGLCKRFFELAEPLVKWITEQKDNITASRAELEEQLEYVKVRIQSLAKDGAQLGEIRELSKKMDEAGITNNRYTTLTEKDVTVLWEQWSSFLDKKKSMLESEIERHKLRGITQEQFKEIEENFKLFDADNNGAIDRRELKGCLYSLGEEKGRQEIEQIMKEYGDKDGHGIKYLQFREFMINVLGVSDSKEDILNSFVLINRGPGPILKQERGELILDTPDVEYLKQTAPAKAGGWDFVVWTDDVFSR